jgi:5-formyltetrahydrofolate cyclo-ligase
MSGEATWRRAERHRLRAQREAFSEAFLQESSATIARNLEQALPSLTSLTFGFYWALPGEPDLRDAASRWIEAGAQAALPETAKNQPLTFRPWQPGAVMRPGIWNIPVPETPAIAHPDVLIIPCLGHDTSGYRLGHGGGFYDRTLAAASPRPLAVGVGYSQAALATIHPQAHDIPMDVIVTELAIVWHSPHHAAFR